MIGILVLSHGGLAEGIKDSAQLIMGTQEKLEVESLSIEMLADNFEANVRNKIHELDDGDGVLVLIDIFGGTPFKVMCRIQNEFHCSCLAGVNLPMLLDAICNRDDMNLAELVEQISGTGKEGVRTLPVLGNI